MKRSWRAAAVVATLVVSVFGIVGVRSATNPPAAHAWAPYYNGNATEGSVYRLYQAFFLREPDQGGFGYWMKQRTSGKSIAWISSYFSQSAEFKARYGTLNNPQFMTLVYQNVMGRVADPEGYNYWVRKLDGGLSRGFVMVLFSDSVEYRAKTVLGVPPGYRAGTNALNLLAVLSVAVEDRTGYDRSLFKHWDDEDGDGCDTRCEVLAAEVRADGTWYSVWDNEVIASATGIQIDHVVPLAEAWDSGARSWDADRRDRFADWQTNLIGVSSSSNQSKSDGDVADWQPPNVRSWCLDAEITVTTKYVWSLSVDPAEKAALSSMLTGCTSSSLTLPPVTAPPTTRPPVTTTPGGCKTAGVYVAKNGVCVANYEKSNGDVNCSDLPAGAKPVTLPKPSNDPYKLDSDHDGKACE